jgi:hypothetical protein
LENPKVEPKANTVVPDDVLTTKEASLKGFTGVEVLVEELDKDTTAIGLSESAIVAAVELRLRRYGIRVLSERESKKSWATHTFTSMLRFYA